MHDSPYDALAAALDRLPNGYPRTESGVELRLLERIFPPEDAVVAAHLGREPATAASVAALAGLPVQAVGERLKGMARRGLVWPGKGDHGLVYRLAPFIVGIYEAQASVIDHETAHLFEEYMAQGGAQGIMGPLPSLHRVVPAQGSLKSEWILPYDDVKALLTGARAFHASDCICRKEKELAGGRPCSVPLHNCLSFSPAPRPPQPDDITRDEAVALLDQAETVGLVHTVSNVIAGVSYVCNCCGCCCGILRGINEYGLEHSVAAANYRSVIDAAICTGCEICMDRCQVGAIMLRDSVAAVQTARCIGCGLCVTGCPAHAARLEPRPEAEVVRPPADFAAWEQSRLVNRGLA